MHDGTLTSVAVGEGGAVLLLTHVDGRQFKLILSGVESLVINDFREGNIILELQVVVGSRFDEFGLSAGDIRAAFEMLFTRPHADADAEYHDAYDVALDKQIRRLEDGDMRLVILDPAYGADLLAFCASAEIFPHN
jgi:hypothetical protein